MSPAPVVTLSILEGLFAAEVASARWIEDIRSFVLLHLTITPNIAAELYVVVANLTHIRLAVIFDLSPKFISSKEEVKKF